MAAASSSRTSQQFGGHGRTACLDRGDRASEGGHQPDDHLLHFDHQEEHQASQEQPRPDTQRNRFGVEQDLQRRCVGKQPLQQHHGADAEHLGDGRGIDLVITGDHGHPDAALMAGMDRLDSLLPRRIEQVHQSEQNQILRQIRGTQTAGADAGLLAPSQRQHPLALPREPVGHRHKALTPQRRGRARAGLLAIAVRQNHLGRALGERLNDGSCVPPWHRSQPAGAGPAVDCRSSAPARTPARRGHTRRAPGSPEQGPDGTRSARTGRQSTRPGSGHDDETTASSSEVAPRHER
jgi:hypothetical protein